MQLSKIRILFYDSLDSLYDKQEIESIFTYIIAVLLNYSKIEIHQNLYKSIDKQIQKKILEYLARLVKMEPLQYILGFTEFYDLKLSVDKRVLIPRPETEFLVDLIIKENNKKEGLTIMDLCTGSGCIAIALSKKLKNAEVFALDFSEDALDVANKNAFDNKAKVNFIRDDLLSLTGEYLHFDLIVSNPPYVRDSEKKLMKPNVLNYEPASALFVPDNDPLKFYLALAKFGIKYLTPAGIIYAEINENLGNDLIELFKQKTYSNVTIRKDLNDKNRYLTAML
jgi:release factor glutamine methyltransferase